jgi:hypothetical protein
MPQRLCEQLRLKPMREGSLMLDRLGAGTEIFGRISSPNKVVPITIRLLRLIICPFIFILRKVGRTFKQLRNPVAFIEHINPVTQKRTLLEVSPVRKPQAKVQVAEEADKAPIVTMREPDLG